MVIQADRREQNTSGVIYEHGPPGWAARGNGLVVAAERACPPHLRKGPRHVRGPFQSTRPYCGLARGPPELIAHRTPVSLDCGLRRRCARRWFTQAGSVCVEGLPAGLRRSGDFADGVRGCPCDMPP